MRGNARLGVRVWCTLQRSYHRATGNFTHMSDCPHSVAFLLGSGEGTNPHFRSDPLCDRWKPCYHIANLFWMHQLESNDAFWRSFTFIVVQLMYDLEERGGMLRAIFISHACETGVVRQAMGQKRCSWYCTATQCI